MRYFEVLYLDNNNFVNNDIIAKVNDQPPTCDDFYAPCKKILAYKETDNVSFQNNEQKHFKLMR